jgi:hypothetical protein
VFDEERLKNGQYFGKDYFDELLEKIREIRASERRFYQKITDIYATSSDYDKDAPMTKEFFANVLKKKPIRKLLKNMKSLELNKIKNIYQILIVF